MNTRHLVEPNAEERANGQYPTFCGVTVRKRLAWGPQWDDEREVWTFAPFSRLPKNGELCLTCRSIAKVRGLGLV